MKSIRERTINELIINKSKFITVVMRVEDHNDVDDILNNIKNEYQNATHYTYAYIIGDIKKCSDDKEPSGTAGIPILSVLEANNLNMVLCVVIRYFGGIKLGSGGLIRAYRESANKCIKIAELVNIIKAKLITISFKYDEVKSIDNILNDSLIINKTYDDKITYDVIVDNDTILKLNDYKIIKDTYLYR